MKRYTQEISLLQPEHSRETFQFIISKLSIQLVSWRGEANHQWNHWKDINILWRVKKITKRIWISIYLNWGEAWSPTYHAYFRGDWGLPAGLMNVWSPTDYLWWSGGYFFTCSTLIRSNGSSDEVSPPVWSLKPKYGNFHIFFLLYILLISVYYKCRDCIIYKYLYRSSPPPQARSWPRPSRRLLMRRERGWTWQWK